MSTMLSLLGGFVVIATLVSMVPLPHWWFRGFDFPRFQLFWLGVAVLAGLLWQPLPHSSGQWLPAILLAAVVYQAIRFWPWTQWRPVESCAPGQPDDERSVSVLVANVLMSNRDARRLLSIIRQSSPDLVLTLESDAWWQARLEEGLQENYEHRVLCPHDNWYGMHLFSRLPLSDEKVLYRVQDDVPSMRVTVTLPTGQPFELHALHPAPPSPTENDEATERDGELMMVAREIEQRGGSVIVAGDFNDVPWSRSQRLFRKVAGLLDPRVGRGRFCTYHARIPLLRWPLDQVVHSSDFCVRALRRLPGFGSDHFPFLVRLQHEPRMGSRQPRPRANETEHQQADEKIAAAEARADDA